MTVDNFCHTIDELLTFNECEELLKFCKTFGWNTINDKNSKFYNQSMDNEKLAEKLYLKIKPFIPKSDNIKYDKITSTFTFLKFEEGNFQNLHRDGLLIDNDSNKTYLTLYIFLNDNFQGGNISFYQFNPTALNSNIDGTNKKNKKNIGSSNRKKLLNIKYYQKVETIRSGLGKGVLFYNNFPNRDEIVTQGFKYILKCNVLAK